MKARYFLISGDTMANRTFLENLHMYSGKEQITEINEYTYNITLEVMNPIRKTKQSVAAGISQGFCLRKFFREISVDIGLET